MAALGSCEKPAKQQVRPWAGTLTLDSPQLGRAGGTPRRSQGQPDLALEKFQDSSQWVLNSWAS